MLIIKILAEENGQHMFESQSHRTKCWIDGFLPVPSEFEDVVFGCQGFCNIKLNKDGTEIVGITALDIPEIVDAEPTTEELLNAMLGV
jgi:hypothetical protein